MNFDSQRLKQWFEEEKRELPWRDNPSPYAVWVSEIMLQQTQVAVVVPYFQRWMSLFPTIEALAKAPLDVVIKCWEGLGYYARARALHTGAQYVVDHFQGILPSGNDELRKIKGIGPYTVGAIRSFAFKQKAPAVDGNVMRVLSRYFLISDDIGKSQTIKKIWELAEAILPDVEPWTFNEALIELGATICRRKPNCSICPLKDSCQAYVEGNPTDFPYQSKKVKIESLQRAVAIISHTDRLLIRREEKGKIMSDLHEFPYLELTSPELAIDALERHIQSSMGLQVSLQSVLDAVSHSFTRFNVQLFPAFFSCINACEVPGYQWMKISDLEQLAFSSGHRRIFEKFLKK
ncbi:MAG: A/G-specific adenine glycosylase [Parachlamydiaceae bacterium]|nr:A/G-specific adenine glycosylase [Parachlamydiaceae bacterium]